MNLGGLSMGFSPEWGEVEQKRNRDYFNSRGLAEDEKVYYGQHQWESVTQFSVILVS